MRHFRPGVRKNNILQLKIIYTKLCKIVPSCAKVCKTVPNCAKLCKMFELSLVLHALAHFGTFWHISTQFSKKKNFHWGTINYY